MSLSIAYTPSIFASAEPTLYFGDRGTYVSQLQQDLNGDGFPVGSIDGIFEPLVGTGTYKESLVVTKSLNLVSVGIVVLDEAGKAQGIYVQGVGAAGTTFSGFTIQNPQDHGIFVQDTKNVTIANNTITGAVRGVTDSKDPKYIAEDKPLGIGVTDSVVSGDNVVNNKSDGGIGLSDDGAVEAGWPTPGAQLPAENNTIEGNVIYGNQEGCGIVVASYNAGQCVINNTVVDNVVAYGVAGIVIAADTPNSSAINNVVKNNVS